MNLKEQQYLVALADFGSITKAASHLGVSQPALSTYIANVETGLGVKLFDRIGKRLVPTFLGEIYLQKARQIMALGQEFNAVLHNVTSGHSGRLRVGLQIRRSPYIVPSLLRAFRNYYPNIEVILYEHNTQMLETLLLQDQLDLLLCNKTVEKQDMEYLHLYDDRLLFVIASDHPLRYHAQYRAGLPFPWIDLNPFREEQFILQHEGQSIRFFTNQVLAELSTPPRKIFLIRNIETASQLAAEGMGVAFTLESYARNLHCRRPPVYFVVGNAPCIVDFSVAYRKGENLPEYTKQFIEILRSIMQE